MFAFACVLGVFIVSNIFVLAGLFVLIGIQLAFVDTLEASYASDLIPSELRGTGFGGLQTVNSRGDLTSSIIVGALWTLVSPTAGFAYGAILSFTSVGVFLYFTRPTKMQTTTTSNSLLG
jgi:MFS family permease